MHARLAPQKRSATCTENRRVHNMYMYMLRVYVGVYACM